MYLFRFQIATVIRSDIKRQNNESKLHLFCMPKMEKGNYGMEQSKT